MLMLGSELDNSSVMGLQTGSELARVDDALIDPWTLSIIAYKLDGPLLSEHPSFLLITDVREFSNLGMIVDSSDEFVGQDDVIKIKQISELRFSPLGLKVVDEHGVKLGKVEDYSVEVGNFVIQQLVVKRPVMKSFSDSQLLIHRSQIVEINDTTITVKTTAEKIVEPTQSKIMHYTNPFRSGSPQPEAIRSKD